MLGGREVLLISCDLSSLVVDSLCKRAAEENAAVACFYFDSTAQKDQSPTAILGSVLKQIVSGLEVVPERIVEAYEEQVRFIGGRRLAFSEIMGNLRTILTSRRTYICLDGLDECRARDRVELLDLLNDILRGSPDVRIFLTGRPHIRVGVKKHLAGRAVARSITPTENDIVIFLRTKLKEDTMPEAMDESLEEEIIRVIPEAVSKT